MNQIPEHFYRQSAVLPYRIEQGRLKILLITSRKRKRWVLPKGIVESDLSPAESAKKEALEEAGIEGTLVDQPLGTYSYEKWDGHCTVEVFPMFVEIMHPTWEENERTREWLSPSEAAARIDETELQDIIRTFAEDKENPLSQGDTRNPD